MEDIVEIIFSRLLFWWGKKPKNVKCSESNPETERAVVIEDGPGIGTILWSVCKISFASRVPGSCILGVPASETRAISPVSNASNISERRFNSIKIVMHYL